MTCWSCGGGIPEGSRFCGLCGARQNPTGQHITEALAAWQPPPSRRARPRRSSTPRRWRSRRRPRRPSPRPAPRFRALAAADGRLAMPAEPVRPSAWGVSEAPAPATGDDAASPPEDAPDDAPEEAGGETGEDAPAEAPEAPAPRARRQARRPRPMRPST
ncbi:MAG: hypothetical protein R3F43_30315 [bacterium]